MCMNNSWSAEWCNASEIFVRKVFQSSLSKSLLKLSKLEWHYRGYWLCIRNVRFWLKTFTNASAVEKRKRLRIFFSTTRTNTFSWREPLMRMEIRFRKNVNIVRSMRKMKQCVCRRLKLRNFFSTFFPSEEKLQRGRKVSEVGSRWKKEENTTRPTDFSIEFMGMLCSFEHIFVLQLSFESSSFKIRRFSFSANFVTKVLRRLLWKYCWTWCWKEIYKL